MDPDRHFDEFRTERAAFRALLELGDLAAPITGCPGWNLADLGAHLGGIYGFARTAITERRDNEPNDGPRERDALLSWFDEQAAALGSTLRRTDWEEACWTMGEPRTTAFWARRMHHETALHRWDAEVSQGRSATIAEDVAADGVDEIVTMFFPRQVRLKRTPPLAHTLQILMPAHPPLMLGGDGAGSTGRGEAPVEATLSGPAQEVLLLLWKRIALADTQVALDGDERVVLEVLAERLTP